MEALKMETCSHEHLLEIDQSHGYTAIANDVMMHIIANPIIASASRLWILIRFQQSGFYDREYIERTISWLAKKLNVSSSTIQKWQRLLEREGYLEIIERKYQSKNNRPNRYRACLPKSVAKEIKSTSKVYTKYTLEVAENASESALMASSSEVESAHVEQTSIETINPKPPLKELMNSIVIEEDEWIKQLIPGLIFEIEGSSLWITGVNSIAKRYFESERERIVTYFNSKGYDLSSLKYNKDQKPSGKEDHKIIEKPSNRCGTTPVYNHTQHRIYKQLLNLSINGHKLQISDAKRLCKELIFSITYGSLSLHPTLMGINIGLKLIRENRWRTPAGYPQQGSQI